MATNNYFGFAHGGTQYSTPTGTGYQTAQTSYSVTPATTYPAATRTGQTAYDNFQGTHTTTAYGFGTRPQEPAQPPPPATNQTYESFGYNRAGTAATTYDGTKAFFQQSQGTYTGGTDTQYTAGSTYSGYDAALYSAATMYVQQQQGSANSAGKGGAGSWSFKKPGMKMNKPKAPPKPQQLHYCDVCKISCAGPQTYREHLEGQKHKKKEAALKGGPTTPLPRGTNSLRCELCDVTCTGSDAYAAHIRGAKHQKVVKLHTRLGKPIPSTEPTVIGMASGSTTTTAGKGTSTSPNLTNKLASGANATAMTGSAMPVKKVIIAPKINFIGGTKLNTTGGGGVEAKEMKVEEITEEMKMEVLRMEEKDVQPVGQEYIEEIKNDEGKVISFQCKLCECRFNDPNAKEMHMKGRRHRLQYKKKVNPDLVVDIKPSLRQRKLQEEKVRRRQQLKDEFLRRREEDRWREEMRMMEEEERIYWEERRRYEEEMEHYEWVRRFGRTPGAMPPPPRPFPGNPPNMPPMMMRRPDTSDDRHVLAKHAQIYPMEDELQAVQKIVSNCEKALKGVSDSLTDSETLKKEEMVKIKTEPVEGEEDKKETLPPRLLKGVMRVGLLAKGLLLKGDIRVDLVVLCSEKPTGTLLRHVAELLPKHLNAVTEEKYHVELHITQSAIVATALVEPKAKVTITLTSPIMREGIPAEAAGESVNVKDPPDVLDRQKCLDALAALRHAKWFQARASNLQPCVMIIRIMRDLCQRVPTWTALDNWAMELLVEKVLASGGHPFSPGDALRRVLEAIASGVILPGGPGLLDPCEKEPTDATANMTRQEKEDITASAQHALRLVAFRQIHKVLGMDPLPAPKFPKGRFTRKRRRDNSGSEGNEGDGKKDKKDEGEMDTQDGTDGKQVAL